MSTGETPGDDPAEREAARLAREVTARAIRRLDILEWVILAAAVAVSLMGGGVVALIVGTSTGLDVRLTWALASLLLFGIPAAVVLRRMREEERASRERLRPPTDENGGQ